MYEYLYAMVKEKGRYTPWKQRNFVDLHLGQIEELYDQIVLVLRHPLQDDLLSLDFKDIPVSLRADKNDLTISQWLATLGNQSLPTKTHNEAYALTYATYSDAWASGYTIKAVSRYQHPDQDVVRDQTQDLLIERSDIAPERLHQECLFTVNGFMHQSTYTPNGTFIIDGASTGWAGKNNNVGIWHLGKAKTFTTYPIHSSDNPLVSHTGALKTSCVITLPNKAGALDDKTVLFSLGGYLHLNDQLIKRVGERSWEIDFDNYPFPQHFFDMVNNIDTQALRKCLDTSSVNARQVNLEQLYADSTLSAFLSLTQSFFIVLDASEVVVRKRQLAFENLPGVYTTQIDPVYPLSHHNGKLSEYIYRREEDRWVVKAMDPLVPHYLFETFNWKEAFSIDDSKVPSRLHSYTDAYFLLLGCYN